MKLASRRNRNLVICAQNYMGDFVRAFSNFNYCFIILIFILLITKGHVYAEETESLKKVFDFNGDTLLSSGSTDYRRGPRDQLSGKYNYGFSNGGFEGTKCLKIGATTPTFGSAENEIGTLEYRIPEEFQKAVVENERTLTLQVLFKLSEDVYDGLFNTLGDTAVGNGIYRGLQIDFSSFFVTAERGFVMNQDNACISYVEADTPSGAEDWPSTNNWEGVKWILIYGFQSTEDDRIRYVEDISNGWQVDKYPALGKKLFRNCGGEYAGSFRYRYFRFLKEISSDYRGRDGTSGIFVSVDDQGKPAAKIYTMMGTLNEEGFSQSPLEITEGIQKWVYPGRWYKITFVLNPKKGTRSYEIRNAEDPSSSAIVSYTSDNLYVPDISNYAFSIRTGKDIAFIDNVEILIGPPADEPENIVVKPDANTHGSLDRFAFMSSRTESVAKFKAADAGKNDLFWEDFQFKPMGDIVQAAFAIPYAVWAEYERDEFGNLGEIAGSRKLFVTGNKLDDLHKIVQDGVVKGTINYRWKLNGINVVSDRLYEDDYASYGNVYEVENPIFEPIPGYVQDDMSSPNLPPYFGLTFSQPGTYLVELDLKSGWIEVGETTISYPDYGQGRNLELQTTSLTVNVLDRTAPWIIVYGDVPSQRIGAETEGATSDPENSWLITPDNKVSPIIGMVGEDSTEKSVLDDNGRWGMPILSTDDPENEMTVALSATDPDKNQQSLLSLLPWTGQNWTIKALVSDNFSNDGFVAWRSRQADSEGNTIGNWREWKFAIESLTGTGRTLSENLTGLRALIVNRENVEWNALTETFGTEVSELSKVDITIGRQWPALYYQLRVSDKQGWEDYLSGPERLIIDPPSWDEIGNWVETPEIFIRVIDNDAPQITAFEVREEQSKVPVMRYPLKTSDFESIVEKQQKDKLEVLSQRLLDTWDLFENVHARYDEWEGLDEELMIESRIGEDGLPAWQFRTSAFSTDTSDILTIDCTQERYPHGFFVSPCPGGNHSDYQESVGSIIKNWQSGNRKNWGSVPNSVQDSIIDGTPRDDSMFIDLFTEEHIPGTIHSKDTIRKSWYGTFSEPVLRRGCTFLAATPLQITRSGRYIVTVKAKDNWIGGFEFGVEVYYHPPVDTNMTYQPYYKNFRRLSLVPESDITGSMFEFLLYRSPAELYSTEYVNQIENGEVPNPVNFDEDGNLDDNVLPGLLVVEAFDKGSPGDPTDPEVFRRIVFPVYVRSRPVVHERVSVEKRHTLEKEDHGSSTTTTGDDRLQFKY